MRQTEESKEIVDRLAARINELLGEGQTARLYLKGHTRRPISYIWSSDNDKRGTLMEERRVLGASEKSKRLILVEDTEEAPIMRRLSKCYFKSCLAVPILDSNDVQIGALFLSSDEPGSFDESSKELWEKEAVDMRADIVALVRIHVADVSPISALISFLFSRRGAAVLIVALVLGGGYLWEPNSGPKVTEVPPELVASRFRESLLAEDYTTAWVFLEPELRGRWSGEEFKASFAEWQADQDHVGALTNSAIGNVERNGNTAIATLTAPGQPEWKWTLVSEGKTWYIDKMEGGPVESPPVAE